MSISIAFKVLHLLRNPFNSAQQQIINYHLTSREIEILQQLKSGLSHQQISINLFISQGTVRKHIENTYKKLKVNNKLSAVELAIKHRII